jgi:hypothetical protein
MRRIYIVASLAVVFVVFVALVAYLYSLPKDIDGVVFSNPIEYWRERCSVYILGAGSVG